MRRTQKIRETLPAWLDPDYVRQRESQGWRMVAVEWEREVEVAREIEGTVPPGAVSAEEIPYGLQIAADCHHLEENPEEMQILKFLAEMIVQDASFTGMAAALNERDFRARGGQPWTAAAVFKLTPRLIEVAPRILSGQEWESRKKQISRVAWNS